MSVIRNPASFRNAAILMALIVAMGLLAGCESADKYKKKPAAEVQEQEEPTGGEFALSGSPAELAWVKNMAEALDAARLKYDLRDTVGAIVSADSLSRVAETALDTIPMGHPMNDFLAIYVADVYGTLQKWETERGNHAAVTALSKRYNLLAERLQHRRDSVMATDQ